MVCPDGTPWDTGWTPRTESLTPAAHPAPEPQGADKAEPADTSVIGKGPERAGILALKPCNWEKRTGTESAVDSFMRLVLCQGKSRLTGQKQEEAVDRRTAGQGPPAAAAHPARRSRTVAAGDSFPVPPPEKRGPGAEKPRSLSSGYLDRGGLPGSYPPPQLFS